MGVCVVVEVDPPRERARRQRPVFASLPVPENDSVVPPEYLEPAVGVTIVRAGAVLLVIVRMPALLVTVPATFVTTQR
jgi:hypothetical protein